MRRSLTVLAALGVLSAAALPIEASAAANREKGVSKGEITDFSSRRYYRHYYRPYYHRYGYGYPYYYRPWGYPYYSYRPYWGGPGFYFGFGPRWGW